MVAACLLTTAFPQATLRAQNWDEITTSPNYYFGEGHGETVAAADEMALANLSKQISTYVKADFNMKMEEKSVNGEVEGNRQMTNIISTYSQVMLTNVHQWVVNKEPKAKVRRYMERSELKRFFEERTAMALQNIDIAREALEKRKVDMALQYYYRALMLVRTLQYPGEAKDAEGHVLVEWLPKCIDDVLEKVKVEYDKRDGDRVYMLFSYDGEPVSSIDFMYNDGRAECNGSAKDGQGMLEMAKDYQTDVYHLSIEYEYKDGESGDVEMQSVYDVIPRRNFKRAHLIIAAKPQRDAASAQQTQPKGASATATMQTGIHLQPSGTQAAQLTPAQANVMEKVLQAIATRRYATAEGVMTLDALVRWRELVKYGRGRVVGTPNIVFFKGREDRVVARGLQMAFTFERGTKKSFVEDVVFTLNPAGKIENLAFGLGQVAANDILCKHPSWQEDTRELIMEFMENYKTAYCLKDSNYIRNVFADDAIIIVGNVAKQKGANLPDRRQLSMAGQEKIQRTRYTKEQYLRNLNRCFRRNEFINLRFTNNDVQWLEKYDREELFAIQIGQEYHSSTYSDRGYLFLLVDMTDHDQPQIKIRTWQPNWTDMKNLYSVGDFYDE